MVEKEIFGCIHLILLILQNKIPMKLTVNIEIVF